MGILDKLRGISPEERENLNRIKASAFTGRKAQLDRERRENRERKKLKAHQERAEKAAEKGKKAAEFGRVFTSPTPTPTRSTSYPQKISGKSPSKAKQQTKTQQIGSAFGRWADRKAAEMKSGAFGPGMSMYTGITPTVQTSPKKKKAKTPATKRRKALNTRKTSRSKPTTPRSSESGSYVIVGRSRNNALNKYQVRYRKGSGGKYSRQWFSKLSDAESFGRSIASEYGVKTTYE